MVSPTPLSQALTVTPFSVLCDEQTPRQWDRPCPWNIDNKRLRWSQNLSTTSDISGHHTPTCERLRPCSGATVSGTAGRMLSPRSCSPRSGDRLGVTWGLVMGGVTVMSRGCSAQAGLTMGSSSAEADTHCSKGTLTAKTRTHQRPTASPSLSPEPGGKANHLLVSATATQLTVTVLRLYPGTVLYDPGAGSTST